MSNFSYLHCLCFIEPRSRHCNPLQERRIKWPVGCWKYASWVAH